MNIKILVLGDVVGRPGRTAIRERLRSLRERVGADLVIVNGENASGGVGIEGESAREIRAAGADVITLGDHTWQRKEAKQLLEDHRDWIIRPANYPEGAPGRGWTIVEVRGIKVGIFNLLGRVFISAPLDCPFRSAEKIVGTALKDCPIKVLDMHAEATSEKIAMSHHLDGKISLQVGTHTHVPTADERICPHGTASITDLGMCGSEDGVIGMDASVALARFMTGMNHAYQVSAGNALLRGVVCEVDAMTGRAVSIERVVDLPPVERRAP